MAGVCSCSYLIETSGNDYVVVGICPIRLIGALIIGVYPDSLKIGNIACGEAVLGFVCMDDSCRLFVAS